MFVFKKKYSLQEAQFNRLTFHLLGLTIASGYTKIRLSRSLSS
jgi:hypothetical protein